jgi:hypothetical protein
MKKVESILIFLYYTLAHWLSFPLFLLIFVAHKAFPGKGR